MVLASEPLASHWPKYLQSGFLIGGSKETYYGLPTRRVQCRAHVRPHAIRGRPAALVIPVRPLRRVYCWQAASLLPTARHPGAPWLNMVHPGASLQPALLLNASVTLPHKHAEWARRRQGSAWSLSRAGWALFASLRTAAVLHVAFTTRLCEIMS